MTLPPMSEEEIAKLFIDFIERPITDEQKAFMDKVAPDDFHTGLMATGWIGAIRLSESRQQEAVRELENKYRDSLKELLRISRAEFATMRNLELMIEDELEAFQTEETEGEKG